MRHRSIRHLLPALSLAAIAWPASASAEALLTVTAGGLPPVSVGGSTTGGKGATGGGGGGGTGGGSGSSSGSSSGTGVSGVGVSVLPEGKSSLVEVSVAEKPVVSVPAPSPGAPEAPVTKSPAVPVSPELPATPVGGTSSGGGSSGGGSSGSGSSGGSGSDPVASAAATTASAAASGAGGGPATSRTNGASGSSRPAAAHRARSASHAKGSGAANGGASTALTASPAGPGGAGGGAGNAGTPSRRTIFRTVSKTGGQGGALASLGRDLPLPLPVPDWSKPIIALLLALALAFGVRWWFASRRANVLEAQKRTLLRDVDVLQAALVPEVPATVGGLDVSVAYHPSEGPAAGGDFYDVFELDEHRVAVMLGDVTGHGHEALQRAAQARYTLRAHMQEERMPRRALARTSQALIQPGFEQLATVAVGVYDSRRGTLTYALAGHPAPILLGMRAQEAPLACSSPPLGWDVPTGRRQRTVSLPEGARVCFFSDGLIEARLQARQEQNGRPSLLGPARLRRLLEGLGAQGGAEELLAAVRAHTTATPDDMAACILTAREGRTGASVDIEELEIGEAALERGRLDSFLSSLSLSETAHKGLTASVRARLRDSETAVLLVDRSKRSPRVRVAAADGTPRAGDGVAPDLVLRA